MTMEQSKFNNSRNGQSLIELMIAVAVGAILIGSAAVVMSAWIRISAQNKFLQAASFLSQDLMDKVTIYAESLWYSPTTDNQCLTDPKRGLYNLIPKSNAITKYRYHLLVQPGQPFTCAYDGIASNAGETVTVDGTVYTRYFYVEDVKRMKCGIENITISIGTPCSSPGSPGNADDPSTQKVTVVTSWPSGGNVTLVRYLTRNRNQVIVQTDWSGGPTTPSDPDIFATTISNKFYSADSGIDYTGTPGSILLK